MHKEDPFCALNRPFIEHLIWNEKITAMKYGDAWLINLDELFSYFQYKKPRLQKDKLPLKVNMKTSGQIIKVFQEADPYTIIRKTNLKRFCAANNIHSVINNEVHKPLYDFNEILMKVNPKEINYSAPMTILRYYENAVRDIKAKHANLQITWKLVWKVLHNDNFFKTKNGKRWLINCEEFEECIIKKID